MSRIAKNILRIAKNISRIAKNMSRIAKNISRLHIKTTIIRTSEGLWIVTVF